MVLRNSNENGYIENTPEVEVEAALSSCCWRLWGSRVVEIFFLIAMGDIDNVQILKCSGNLNTERANQTKFTKQSHKVALHICATILQ
jgi:hypothetical protein